MKFRDMLPFRRSLLLSIALTSISVNADALFQTYCSTQNTGSDYSAVNSIYMSNGKCHDICINNGNYAFAVVQWQNCWCSNYAPGNQASVSEDCNATCPGYPDELCGNQDTGYFGYVALNAQPSGTIGGSTSSAQSTSNSPTSDDSTTSPSSTKTTTTPATTAAPVIPVTSTIIQTIGGSVVTQTVTSTPILAPGSNSDNIQVQRKNGVSAGTVAGIVIGVVAGLALLALAAFLLWRRRRQASDSEDAGAAGSNKSMTRNISVLSKAGLISRGRPTSMSERDHDEQYYIPPLNGDSSVRHSMMFGAAGGVDPISPLDSSHSSGSRRPSKPMVYDQRLNPSALFANSEANGSRISMQDTQDYSRPLGVMNPDPRPSFESRL